MESEKLRKCVDFGELRAGVLIRVMPCIWCNSQRGHRYLLEGWANVRSAANPEGGVTPVHGGWWRAPNACGTYHPVRGVVTSYAVDEGLIYIIETGVDKETTREAARELEGVR